MDFGVSDGEPVPTRIPSLAGQLCNSFAGRRADIRTVRDLPGHKDVQTAMIYLHVMNKSGLAVKSPADGFVERSGTRGAV